MAQKRDKSSPLLKRLNRGSILWRAVLHSVVLSTIIIVVLSTTSYVFIISMVQRGVLGISVYELLQYGAQLGKTLLIFGGVFLALAVVLSFSFGRRLAEPFMEMREKVEKIRPGHWKYRHTIRTNDEAEELDKVISSLTRRLQEVYENLEGIIAERTQQLREEYAKDRTILRTIRVGILVVDKNGTVLQVNPATASLLKTEERAIIGKHITAVLPMQKHEKLLAKEEHPVVRCLHDREEVLISPEVHLNVLLSGGTMLPVKVSVTPLQEKRTLLGAIVSFQDVTMERQLDYMKSDFITVASHHLRTPLSTVQWYLELLSAGDGGEKLTKEQKSFVVEMRMATKKMTAVLGELMDASRISEEGFTPIYDDVDMNDIVKDVIRNTQPLMKSKGVQHSVELLPQAAVVPTDRLLAGIIIQNLIHNAVKYSKADGSRVLHIRMKRSKQHIHVSVEDHGIGIPYAEQEHIFQKLYRASNARAVESNGAGLGLYSCRMLADRMGASLSFESKEGDGSTFIASFPVVRKGKMLKKKQQRSTKKRA